MIYQRVTALLCLELFDVLFITVGRSGAAEFGPRWQTLRLWKKGAKWWRTYCMFNDSTCVHHGLSRQLCGPYFYKFLHLFLHLSFMLPSWARVRQGPVAS